MICVHAMFLQNYYFCFKSLTNQFWLIWVYPRSRNRLYEWTYYSYNSLKSCLTYKNVLCCEIKFESIFFRRSLQIHISHVGTPLQTLVTGDVGDDWHSWHMTLYRLEVSLHHFALNINYACYIFALFYIIITYILADTEPLEHCKY